MQPKLYTHFCVFKQLAEAAREFLSFWKAFSLVRVFCKVSALYRICTLHFMFKCLS